MPIIDQFGLQPSPLITINGREEETANFNLQANPDVNAGNISGFVRRPDGTPIPLATVKLFTSNNEPFEHINSNNAGHFIFPRIPVGSYFITAAEPTYLTPVRIPITVLANRNTTITITMQTDPDANKNAVYGSVTDLTSNQAISDATIQLFRIVGTGQELAGIVNSNSQGQYLFANLVNGTYLIDVSKPGYLSNQSAEVVISDREFAPINIGMNIDPDANTGTISGLVVDSSSNNPIANAIVALYSVTNGTETIIEITKSNSGGLYLFGDIPPGTYRVKATVQVDT